MSNDGSQPLRAGFIGLGAMGRGMARNLHRHGLLHGVWNRSRAPADQLASETGVTIAGSAEQLARECDVVVLCVSADQDVLEIIATMGDALRPGTLVIDCSTVSGDTARRAAALLARSGTGFLDAPVSGGVEGARDGTLAIMVGGSSEDFARARPILEAMGRTIAHLGPTGAGQAAKATNQIMCAGVIQAVAEAMAFAKAEGLPLDRLITTLSQGAGSSWYFVHRAPNMVAGTYPAGFRVRLHQKDLEICRAMARDLGVTLPLVEMTLLHYRRLIDEGHGDEDISTIFRLKDALFADARHDGAPAGR